MIKNISCLLISFIIVIKACKLPSSCRIEPFFKLDRISANQVYSKTNYSNVRCDIHDKNYRFDFESWLFINESQRCRLDESQSRIELRFPKSLSIILEARFGLQRVSDFILTKRKREIKLRMINLKGFQIDLGIRSSHTKSPDFYELELVNSRFLHERRTQTSLG